MTIDEAMKMARKAAGAERQAGDTTDAVVFTERELKEFLGKLLASLVPK